MTDYERYAKMHKEKMMYEFALIDLVSELQFLDDQYKIVEQEVYKRFPTLKPLNENIDKLKVKKKGEMK